MLSNQAADGWSAVIQNSRFTDNGDITQIQNGGAVYFTNCLGPADKGARPPPGTSAANVQIANVDFIGNAART